MSLKCQFPDCYSLMDYECSCKASWKLCDRHFRQHGESYGCYATSVRTHVQEVLFKLQQGFTQLASAKKSLMLVVERLMIELQTTLRDINREINKRQKVILSWIKEGLDGDTDHIVEPFRYYGFRHKDIQMLTEQMKRILNVKVEENAEKESLDEFEAALTSIDYIAKFGEDSDKQRAFGLLDVKEKIGFVEKIGISVKDVRNDIYDVKVSRDNEFVFVCMR